MLWFLFGIVAGLIIGILLLWYFVMSPIGHLVRNQEKEEAHG